MLVKINFELSFSDTDFHFDLFENAVLFVNTLSINNSEHQKVEK